MTTGPINIIEDLTGNFTYWHESYGEVDVGPFSGTAYSRQARRQRPQSTLSVPTAGGWRDPKPFNHSGRKVTNPRVSLDQYNGTQQFWHYADLILDEGLPDLPVVDGSLSDEALIKALLKLKNQRINLAQAFAERKQVANMLSGTTRFIAGGVRSFRKLHPRKVWEAIKRGEPTAEWLSLQYGWNPLMSDVAGACQALSQRDADSSRYCFNVTGTSADRNRQIGHREAVGGLVKRQVTEEYESKAKVRLDYFLANPELASFASLGLTNPLHLAWELVPYSFVVDWVYPIGSWLSVLDADFGWQFRGGSTSTIGRYKRTDGPCFINTDVSHPEDRITSQAVGNASAFNFQRIVHFSSPLPDSPSIKNPFSGVHVANAIALLVQAFK